MSVILLSDGSALGTSDEHSAYDLSTGRRITPVDVQAIPQKPAADPAPAPPRPKPARTEPPAVGATLRETSRDDKGDAPASGYLPGSG
jgi:hypothetical protein